MASCPVKTYPLSPSEALAICGRIRTESGISIDPTQPTGSAETHGVTLSWSIHDGQIDIGVVSKPWVIPCSTIYAQLDELFASQSS